MIAAVPGIAAAATIDVTTTADTLANDGQCSLREAVLAANGDAAQGGCPAGGGADTIRLPAETFTLALAGTDDAALNGDLDLTGTVNVVGAGQGPAQPRTTISGIVDRVFEVRPGATVTISDLRVINGNPPDGANGPNVTGAAGMNGIGGSGLPGSDGGGILNQANLTLDRVTVSNNNAGNGGAGGTGTGGEGNPHGGAGTGGAAGAAGNGGGIHSTGTLVIRDSTITDNLGGTGLIGGSGSGGNGADGGNGGSAQGATGGKGGVGGISMAGGSLTMSGSVVSTNTGGIGGLGGGTQNGRGGDATAPNGSGGNGATNQSGFGGAGGAGAIGGSGLIAIDTSAITANEAGNGGHGGTASTGAGGTAMGTGTGGTGGSAVARAGGVGGTGGIDASLLTFTLRESLVAGNTSGKGGNGGGAQAGGGGSGSPAGVAAGGAGGTGGFGAGVLATSGAPTLVNVTFDANVAGAGGTGGGAQTFTGGSGFGGNGGNGGSGGNAFLSGATATHLTATGGTAGAAGIGGVAAGTGAILLNDGSLGGAGSGPGLAAGGGGINLRNSISSGAACSGPFTDGGNNIAFNAGGCPGAAVDPLLGPLADNGGPTQTRRLGAGSPALDSVPATGANCALTDQRGAVRPFGPACDTGAFEVAPPAAATGPPQGVSTTNATVTGTVTARGLPTSYSVQFGETTAYGQTATGGTTSSPTPAGVTVELTGLQPSTTYHYRLTVQSPDGQAIGEDATFTTAALPPPPPPGTKPVLSSLTVRPARFRVARGATPVRQSATPRGTTISYRLSLAATVRLAIQRAGPGVRVRRRGRRVCIAASTRRFRRTARRLRCTFYRTRGTLTRSGRTGRAGLNRFRFTGRIGRRALPTGRYRVRAVASNTAGSSPARTRAFRIIRR
jgi:CSLREA domain-containing protein